MCARSYLAVFLLHSVGILSSIPVYGQKALDARNLHERLLLIVPMTGAARMPIRGVHCSFRRTWTGRRRWQAVEFWGSPTR